MRAGIWDEKEGLGSWIMIKVSSTLILFHLLFVS
jgi:hypothetical protein